MKATLASALCRLLACSTLAASPALAQPNAPVVGTYVQSGPGQVFLGDAGGGERGVPFSPLMVLDRSFGEAPGYDADYTQVRTFLPWYVVPGSSLVFGSIGGSVTDQGDFVGNFGVGYRQYFADWDRIYGAAGFFDVDDGNTQTYTRAGLSLETLGRYLDVRANGYIVLDDEPGITDGPILGALGFRDNRILLTDTFFRESPYSGFDAEIGGLLPLVGRYGLYGYVGGYILTSDTDEDTEGVSVRMEAQVTDDATFGVRYTEDPVFDSSLWFNVALTLPDGRPATWFTPKTVRQRMASPVERRDRIPTKTTLNFVDVPAINPKDNQPFFVVHVVPGAAGGDGTIENPFGSLEQARLANRPGIDIIYVRPNDNGGGANLFVNQAFLLFDEQRLLSTSVAHTFTSTQGTFALPGFTGGPLPLIVNRNTVPESVILLQANQTPHITEVSGFAIDGSGIHDGIRATNVVAFDINRNNIFNAVNGVSLLSTGTSATTGSVNGNTITGNAGSGVLARVFDSGTIALAVANNTLTGNFAGVTLATDTLVTPNASITAEVSGNTISNNTTAGVRAEARGFGRITPNIFNNSIIGNADGVYISAQELAQIPSSRIENNLILGNTVDGIRFDRFNEARIGNVNRISIAGNQILGNGDDGIELIARNANLLDLYSITGNRITANIDDGIALRVEADADLDVNIDSNIIGADLTVPPVAGNLGDGIFVSQIINSAGDTPSVGGVWTRNTIANNGGNGIHLLGTFGTTVPLIIGSADGRNPALGNFIVGNGLNGIRIFGPGSAVIGDNFIGDPDQGTIPGLPANPAAGALLGNALAGIDIEGAPGKNLTLLSNIITFNLGDGLEIQNNTVGQFFIVANSNDFTFNGGRGIDILNQGNAFSDIRFSSFDVNGNGVVDANERTLVQGNAGEGVYVVNTASTAQTQTGPTPDGPDTDPSHGMDRTGSIGAVPQLVFLLDQTDVLANGFNDAITNNFEGTGLVIRVGTSDGGYGFALTPGTGSNGFAGNGFSVTQGGVLLNGGVLAEVTNNRFSGNFGDDVFIESFTSTVDPGVTGGTWNATDFTPQNYQGDPLARLDLFYSNNIVDSEGLTNPGAFYNNAEPNFKSRTGGRTAPDPNGPFVSATRRRNAQRMAFRDLLPPQPSVPAGSATFQYPGTGPSTFRVLSGSDVAPFFPGIFTDNRPYTTPADAGGVLIDGAPDDIPWGWWLQAFPGEQAAI